MEGGGEDRKNKIFSSQSVHLSVLRRNQGKFEKISHLKTRGEGRGAAISKLSCKDKICSGF